MILLSHERRCFSRTNNDRHDADRLIRFAVLSRIEILHILLEHSYDSRRNTTRARAQLADFIATASPLRQFQRRLAVVGSVAHLVAKDRVASRGCGDRGKVHPRDGQEAVSQVPC
jgi:hypothetical protein